MSISALSHPPPQDAHDLLEDGLTAGCLLTIAGRCEVDYDERTASYLGPGERLVIVKPDGTLLLHTTEQRTPVNWQPPGCTHHLSMSDDQLHLQSVRTNPDETIDIRFEHILHVSSLDLTDNRELELVGSEEDLRQQILADPARLEDGFKPLATERSTSAGAIDIYGKDRDGQPVVVELKRRRVGPDAVSQLKRYVDALARETAPETSVRGILVAPSVTERAKSLLTAEELEFVSLAPQSKTEGAPTTLTDFGTG